MRNLEELTIDIIEYYKNKFDGELIINSIEFKTTYVNENHVPKLEKSYCVYGSFDLVTLDNSNAWNIPNNFKSKKSFENAIKMLKIAVDGYVESLLIEKDYVELNYESDEITTLLNSEISEFIEGDFQTLIDYYVEKEDYAHAAKYENLKKEYNEKDDN